MEEVEPDREAVVRATVVGAMAVVEKGGVCCP